MRAEMQEERNAHEDRLRAVERRSSKQAALMAEVTTLAKVTPALEARKKEL